MRISPIGRVVIVLPLLILASVSAGFAAGNSCKPDFSQVDKISKDRVEGYSQPLFATSFMGSMWKAQETYITLQLVHSGSNYGIQLVVQKKEGDVERAVFESQYRAAVGTPMQFGFKDGKPLAVTVTGFQNNSQITGFLSDSKRLTTTVTLAAQLKGNDLSNVREALMARQVDAVRVQLAGGVEISKTVDDKLGRQLMQKAGCFFDGLEMSGIQSQPGPPAAATVAVARTAAGSAGAPSPGGDVVKLSGRYGRKGRAVDYLILNADGTLALRQDGADYAGTYTAGGDMLTVRLSNGQIGTARISENRLVDNNGTEWERSGAMPEPASPSKSAGPAITIEQILQMLAAKLPDDVVIASIEKANPKPSAAPADLIRLKTSGASDAVIRSLVK